MCSHFTCRAGNKLYLSDESKRIAINVYNLNLKRLLKKLKISDTFSGYSECLGFDCTEEHLLITLKDKLAVLKT